MKGYIHSIETFGSVDGPGIRYVVFMQGCPMRCLYCHNPDTWDIGKGREVEPAELLREYEKNKMFYRNGGITVTGGEPLLQIDFLIELFSLAKEKGIHTCVDTSGFTFDKSNATSVEKHKKLIEVCDLFLLDIKHIDDAGHKKLTGQTNMHTLDFAKFLSDNGKSMWIRHVLVPTLTDDDESLKKLKAFIETLKTVEKVEVLPYHTMGAVKYEKLGIEYPLKGLQPPTKERVINARKILRGED